MKRISTTILMIVWVAGGAAGRGEAVAETALEVEGMLAALEGEGSAIDKLAVALKLARLDDSATPAMVAGYRSASEEGQKLLLRALVCHPSEEVSALLLEEVHRGEACSLGVIAAAGQLRVREATPALMAQYEETKGRRRRAILSALSQLRDGRALAVLAAASVSEERVERLTGVSGLQRLSAEVGAGGLSEEDVLALYGCLKRLLRQEDAPRETRLGVVTAMGMTRNAELAWRIAPFVGALDRDMRVRAIGALGRMNAKGEAWRLLEALQDEAASVQVAAIGVLERMEETDSVPDLIPLLRDPDGTVRKRAFRALRTLTGQTLTANPEHWERWLGSDAEKDGDEGELTVIKVNKD